ncbi:FAD-binding oxidoreductase [Jatrophihabitans sp. DSM 45814]
METSNPDRVQPARLDQALSRRHLLLGAGGLGLTGVLAACTPAKSKPAATSTPNSTSSTPARPSLAALSKQLSTPLLLPGNAAYAAAAQLYNPRFDATAKPAAIAQVGSAADVVRCVQFAGSGAAALALRAGGHSYGGWSTGPGLVVDVSRLSTVQVDTGAKTARIGAGAKLASVYAALAAKGVALAAGSCPTVGVTGLTLGGGVGVLTRAFGLTCDAVQSVQLVTADGQLREVTAARDPDLFWALRGGGGGSFGVVTAWTVRVQPAPTVQTFYLQWDFAHASQVLGSWQHWLGRIDNKLWTTCKLLADPAQGQLRATVSGTWIGPPSALPGQLAPLLAAIGVPPSTNVVNSLDYAGAMLLEAGCSGESATQCLADAMTPQKRQPFSATSAVLSQPLPSAGVAAAVAAVQSGMNVAHLVEGGVSFDALGGAVADVAASETAFVHRQALALVQYTATWASMNGPNGSASPAPFDAYVRGQRTGLLPWTGPSAYVNYADASIADYGTAYWGSNYPRLQSVKKQYDPDGLFTFAQAIKA